MKIGAQLYTVRQYTNDKKELSETLARIADIGYTCVHANIDRNIDVEWLAGELNKNGLSCPRTHTEPDMILENPDGICRIHSMLGCRYIGIGCAPEALVSAEAYNSFCSRFLPVANRFKENGFTFAYHNHGMEFNRFEISGRPTNALLQMKEDFSDTVFVLDTYWIQFAGANPAEWIARFSGRIPCMHFKDMSVSNNEQRMAAIGDGNINFTDVVDACKKAGTEYVFVEQDETYGEDPFECLKRSYDFLKKMGLG